MKNGFTAEKTEFCGKSGYMVKQYSNGDLTDSQFILEENYNDFCDFFKVAPKLISKEENV